MSSCTFTMEKQNFRMSTFWNNSGQTFETHTRTTHGEKEEGKETEKERERMRIQIPSHL